MTARRLGAAPPASYGPAALVAWHKRKAEQDEADYASVRNIVLLPDFEELPEDDDWDEGPRPGSDSFLLTFARLWMRPGPKSRQPTSVWR